MSVETQDVVVYAWDLGKGTYIEDWGEVTLDGVAQSAVGYRAIFSKIPVGRHTVSVRFRSPYYAWWGKVTLVLDSWQSLGGDSWVKILIDSPNNIQTGIETRSGGPGSLVLWVTSGPVGATVTVRGKCTGGYPVPSMLLEIYDNNIKIESGFLDASRVSIGSTQDLKRFVTGAGIHTVYGRMVLTNPLGSYQFLTETKEFTLG